MKKENWEEEFKELIVKKYWGACFECCDFEDMMDELKQFISKTIQETEQRVREEVISLIKKQPNNFTVCFGKFNECECCAYQEALDDIIYNLSKITSKPQV